MRITNQDLNAFKEPIKQLVKEYLNLKIETFQLELQESIEVEATVYYKGLHGKINATLDLMIISNQLAIIFKEGTLQNQFLNVDLFDFIFTMIKPALWYRLENRSILINFKNINLPLTLSKVEIANQEIYIEF